MNKQNKIMLYVPKGMETQWEEYASNIDGNIVSNILSNGKKGINNIHKKLSKMFIAMFDELFFLSLPDQVKNQFKDILLRQLGEEGLKLVDEVRKDE